jgi:hypothetical protein
VSQTVPAGRRLRPRQDPDLGREDGEPGRLVHLRTTRSSHSAILQDLAYTHDAVGNIVAIGDNAQQTVYFANAVPRVRRLLPHRSSLAAIDFRLLHPVRQRRAVDAQALGHRRDRAPSSSTRRIASALNSGSNFLRLGDTLSSDSLAGWASTKTGQVQE